MLEAFVAALVAKLSARAVEGVADAASGAWSALLRLVRRKLGTDPGSAGALAAVERDPQDRDRQAELVAALQQGLVQDEEFAAEWGVLWRQAQVEIHAETGGVASQFSGTGRHLLQAGRDVTVNYLASVDRPGEVPHQVPSATATFVNRRAELAILDTALHGGDTPGARIGVLVGTPGVGKTTLARRWASIARGRFPGGELYVDFAGPTGPGDSPAVSEAVASCLRGLGVDERFLPAGLAELTSLFRSRTATAPVLVVLDGVREPAQVRALVPNAPGSAVMVASEYALGELIGEGARMIGVPPLDDEAAVSLLASICGATRIAAEPDAARAVVRWCGGLPVALSVAGARLALDPALSVSDLAAELTHEAGRLAALSLPGWASTGVAGTVAAAFTVAYQRLPEPARRLYRDLGVLPVADLSREVVLAVAASDPDPALNMLVAASLVERAGAGRYRLHQLVRLHAARLAALDDPQRPDQVLRIAVDFYRVRAGWADLAVMGARRLRVGGFDPATSGAADPFAAGPERRPAGLRWLAAERANLLAVLRAAVDAGLDEPAWQLAEAMTALYLNHRHHVDWIEATRLGVQAATRQGRPKVQARLRSLVSRAYADLDDLPRARAEIDAATHAAEQVGDPRVVASVCEFRGRLLERQDPEQAIAAYQQSISLNEQAGEPRGAALGRYFLGCCLDTAGRTGTALPLLRQAREQLLELGDERMADRCTYSIGVAHLHLGEHPAARRELTAAAQAFAAGRLWHYEVPAREALADVAAAAGDRDEARRELSRALDIEQAAGGGRVARLRVALAALD